MMSVHGTDPEDEYDSSADEDYNPESAEARQVDKSSSSSEDEAETRDPTSKRLKKQRDDQNQDHNIENSGDDATIEKGRRKKRRIDFEEEDGGEGGLVQTRAQKLAGKSEKRAAVENGTSTLDVDALWIQMSGGPGTLQENAVASFDDDKSKLTKASGTEPGSISAGSYNKKVPQTSSQAVEPMVTIRRKIEFAGQVTEEERRVPASSAEAKLYQQEQERSNVNATTLSTRGGKSLRRPTKRKSAFDQAHQEKDDATKTASGKKLNTLEKSKLDWAAQVDKDGIAQELTQQSKGKADYLDRMDFLSRMDEKQSNG